MTMHGVSAKQSGRLLVMCEETQPIFPDSREVKSMMLLYHTAKYEVEAVSHPHGDALENSHMCRDQKQSAYLLSVEMNETLRCGKRTILFPQGRVKRKGVLYET